MPYRIVEAPLTLGAGRSGCELAPAALRRAGLVATLRESGQAVEETGIVRPADVLPVAHPNLALKWLPEIAAWVAAVEAAAFAASGGAIPLFLGGDHAISAGTLSGLARRAAASGRPLFVLWLDAHPDLHTLETSVSGNLHGVPLAYVTGREGFAGYFPPLRARVAPDNICMIGIRSVDDAERDLMAALDIEVHGIPALRSMGVAAVLRPFLDRVAAQGGLLHVSLDVDFLDPSVAPGTGTKVPGGASFADACEVMRIVNESGLLTSLDLVELNPQLDDGRTASLLVDLATRLVGTRRRLDRAG